MTTQKPPSQPGCAWAEDCIEICTGASVFVDDQGMTTTLQDQLDEITANTCGARTL
jgi:hypothetical protein